MCGIVLFKMLCLFLPLMVASSVFVISSDRAGNYGYNNWSVPSFRLLTACLGYVFKLALLGLGI